jgi:nucleotide-binding universal stress UspA family protein
MNNQRPTLLVTTDGSAHSLRILPHAAAFARAWDARLLLGQVLLPKDAHRESGESEKFSLARAGDALLSELKAVLESAGIDGQPVVAVAREEEEISDAILRLAQEHGAGMIAMDTRGHGVVHHMLQGSRALDVLARTTLPMMFSGGELADLPVTRERYRLVATSDGSVASQEVLRALAPVLIAGRFEVSLLRVVEKPPNGEAEADVLRAAEAQLKGIRGLLEDALTVDLKVQEIPRMAGIDTAIIEEAEASGANAIAMSAHGTTAARHLIAGSTALTLLGRSPLPVIIARAQE